MFGTTLEGPGGTELARILDGAMAAQVAAVLARLGVPDLLAGGPRPAGEIARELGTAPDPLGRVMAAAAVFGLLRRDETGRYSLAPPGAMLRSDAPGSARSFAAGFLSPPLWASYGRLTRVVASGQAADPAAPGGIYDDFRDHPEEARWFARAMSGVTSLLVSQLTAAAFRPLGGSRFVDVGGSTGTLLAYLLQAVDGSTGVLFDREEALLEAPAFLAEAGLSGRADLVTGNFLDEVPAGGDVYVLSHILHNWNDEMVRVIAGNCHRAGRPGSSLLVIEYLLPEGPEPSVGHLLDLIMLMTLGGRERTRAQHEALLGEAGWALARDTPLDQVLPWHVLEFRRD